MIEPITVDELLRRVQKIGGAMHCHETFGVQTFAYVGFSTEEQRRLAEGHFRMIGLGALVDEGYYPGSSIVEIQIKRCAAPGCECSERPVRLTGLGA